MPDEVKPPEHIGPLNTVESMLVRGEHDRHDAEIKRLEEVCRNLEKSLEQTRRELRNLRDRQARMLLEVLKGRGKTPGALPVRSHHRPDGSTWIIVGGPPI